MCPECRETYFSRNAPPPSILTDPIDSKLALDFLNQLKEDQRKDRKKRMEGIITVFKDYPM